MEKKKLADGGVVSQGADWLENEAGALLDLQKQPMNVPPESELNKPVHTGVYQPKMDLTPAQQLTAMSVKPRDNDISVLHDDMTNPHTPLKGLFMTKRFADGGKVEEPTTEAPHKAPEGPSYDEKRKCIEKALKDKTLKMSDGGTPTDPQALPADAPQESKLAAILQAIGMAGKNAVSTVLPGTQSLTDAVAPSAASAAQTPGIAPAINAATGSNLQDASAQPSIASPAPPVMPPAAPAQRPMSPAMAPSAAKPAVDPLAHLGQFDPNSVAPGMNAGDRQDLANQGIANQHSFGNYLGEALGGIGDALAAKGGVQQNSLGAIIGLQKQQRDEALTNFDKAREIAVQNHTMKNQADQDLINTVKARGELLVSPAIAKTLGHPEWANKPTAQVSLALSAQKNMLDYTNNLMQRKQAALKDSADSVDQALKTGGIGGTQKAIDPASRLKMVYTNAIRNDPEAFGYQVSEAGK